MANDEERSPPVRLDKWLYAARFFKTRALANKAIQSGKVIIDKQKPKPSRTIQMGTVITISNPLYEQTIQVKFLSENRQSAKITQNWYEETPSSLEKKQVAMKKRNTEKLMQQTAPNPKQKPTKQGRRSLRNMKRRED